jgi:hypothetical protein
MGRDATGTSFDEYLEHLCKAVGHNDRRAGLTGYLLTPARLYTGPLAEGTPQVTRPGPTESTFGIRFFSTSVRTAAFLLLSRDFDTGE